MRKLDCAVCAAALLLAITGSWDSKTWAQDSKRGDEVRKEIEKDLETARKSLLDKVSKVLADQDARIASLEKALKDKDQEIAGLKKRIEDLAAAKPKAVEKPAEPAKPKTPALLGVAHEAPSDAARAQLNLKAGQGAQVASVEDGSPAAKAGIQVGDVIVSLGGKEAGSANLRDLVRAHGPGDKVEVVYLRGAEKITRTVELVDRDKFLAAAPAEPAKTPDAAPPAAKPEPVVLGILIEETDAGLAVQNVESGKTGAAAELKEGDVLVSANGKKLKKLEDLTDVLGKTKIGENLALEYKRKDEVFSATVVAAGEKGESKLVKIEKAEPAKPAAEKKPDAVAKRPARLGVEITEEADGIKVLDVRAGSPAAGAGVQKGDVIRELAGKKVKTIDDLRGVLSAQSAGDEVKLVLGRGTEEKVIEKLKLGGAEEVAAAKPPEAAPAAKPEAEKPAEAPAPPRPRGTLGILAGETDDLRIVVSSVNPNGPADKAGLKKDDVIVKVNGVEIKKGFLDLEKILEKAFAGDVLKVTVKRGEEMKEIDVQLGGPDSAAEEESGRTGAAPPAETGAGSGVYVGVTLLEEPAGELAAAAARILVEEVLDQSPAARAGLRLGDEVLAIDGEAVRSLDEVGGALRGRSPGQTALFRLSRSGEIVEARLTLEEARDR